MIRKDELETSVTICTRDRRRFLAVESIWCGSRLRAEALLVDQSSTPHPWPSSLSGEAGPQEVAGGFSPSLIVNGSLAFSYRYTTTHDVLGCFRSALHDWGGFDEPLGPGTRFSVAEDDDLVLWVA